MARLLLIANRKTTIDALHTLLTQGGHELAPARNSRQVKQLVREMQPDVLLIDITSMHQKWEALCTSLRRRSYIPIIAIAKRAPRTQNAAAGTVDHWMVKPYSSQALLDAVNELARRPHSIAIGDIELSLRDQYVDGSTGQISHLTPKEFYLLKLLMENAGEVVTRAEIMMEVWETDYTADTRTLDVHIRWLREKIEAEPSDPVYIQTVRGTGYRFVSPEETADMK